MSASIPSSLSKKEIISAKVVTRRRFFCFRTKRLEFTTKDLITYSVAIRTFNHKRPNIPKRFFAVKYGKETILINKKSFSKRVKISYELVKNTQLLKPSSPPKLDTILHVNRAISPLVEALSISSNSKCLETALKINAFVENKKNCLINSEKDFHITKMEDGRPIIAYRDSKTENFCFLADIHYKNGKSNPFANGGYKKVYQYYNFQKQKPNIAVSIQSISRTKDINMARREHSFFDDCRNIPQVLKPHATYEDIIENADGVIGQVYTVMKKYDGDINDCLVNYDIETNLRIFEKIVTGVSEMHKLGIVHRDLKFPNILYKVGKDGEDLSVQIIDLGIACYFDERRDLLSQAGTGYYMPPEVIARDKKKEPQKIDSWALGIMLYKIYFKARAPFYKKISNALGNKAMTSQKCQKLLIKEANLLIKELKKKDEDPWIKLIIDLLQPDPEDRITSEDALKKIHHIYRKS